MARKHVIIAGTGRAGTSFLVELLTCLGLDTGYRPEEISQRLNKTARAGLEKDLDDPNSPYIIKNPRFHRQAEEVLKRKDVVIEHVFVPMRDLAAAAESRRHVTREAHAQWPAWKRFLKKIRGKDGVPGGAFDSSRGLELETELLLQLYQLFFALSDASVPVTLLRFPRMVQDGVYLFAKLQPLLGEMNYEQFRPVWEQVARPNLVHSFSERDR